MRADDLLFVAERLASMLDENRLTVLTGQHGIKKAKDSDSIGKLFPAWSASADLRFFGASSMAHSYGCKSRHKLVTASEVKRNCMRATERGEEAWNEAAGR